MHEDHTPGGTLPSLPVGVFNWRAVAAHCADLGVAGDDGIALAVGVHPSTWGRWKHAVNRPSTDALLRLHERTGIPLNELLVTGGEAREAA